MKYILLYYVLGLIYYHFILLELILQEMRMHNAGLIEKFIIISLWPAFLFIHTLGIINKAILSFMRDK